MGARALKLRLESDFSLDLLRPFCPSTSSILPNILSYIVIRKRNCAPITNCPSQGSTTASCQTRSRSQGGLDGRTASVVQRQLCELFKTI